jgi:hypothetical protein
MAKTDGTTPPPLMAFLELLSGDSAYIDLPLAGSSILRLDASPVPFTSPFTTVRPDIMTDDAEELDPSTLGNFDVEEEE